MSNATYLCHAILITCYLLTRHNVALYLKGRRRAVKSWGSEWRVRPSPRNKTLDELRISVCNLRSWLSEKRFWTRSGRAGVYRVHDAHRTHWVSVELPKLMAILGHANLRSIMRYVHMQTQHFAEGMRTFEDGGAVVEKMVAVKERVQ